MDKRNFVGTFHSIDTVLYKVIELKAQGYSESDIYGFSREQDNISMLSGQTTIQLHGAYGRNWYNGFNKFLSVKERVRDGFKSLGYSDEKSMQLYDEIENGGIALFVDNKHENQLNQADSSAEVNRNGETLDEQESSEQVTTPRMNTEKL